MEAAQLAENMTVVASEIERKRPADAKGDFVLSLAISSTMGPGVKVKKA